MFSHLGIARREARNKREVGAAAFVGLSESGVPSVALGPGRESCWKGRFPSTFSWSPWRLAIWGTLAEC